MVDEGLLARLQVHFARYGRRGTEIRKVSSMPYTDQSPFDARFEWGEAGLRALAPGVAPIAIVDVLMSFSTAVDVAIGKGATVIPSRRNDDSAIELAEFRKAFPR